MLSTDLSANCAPNYESTDTLITFENTLGSAENKGLECAIAYNNIESRFLNYVFYINFCPKLVV